MEWILSVVISFNSHNSVPQLPLILALDVYNIRGILHTYAV